MSKLLEIAAQLVSLQVAKTPMTSDQVIHEIKKVYASLKNLEVGQVVAEPEEAKPAITLKGSFKRNQVVCLICGKGFTTLGRHLQAAHAMSQREYRKQWGISSKQPLAAKSYSESRKQMALDRGLADKLANARKVRMGNIEARKAAPAKPAKAKAPFTANSPLKEEAAHE